MKRIKGKTTEDFVNQALEPISQKLAQVTNELESVTTKVEGRIREFESDLGIIARDILKHSEKLKTVVVKKDERKLWDHFKGYATLDSFKDLYDRCLPQIQRFEKRIADFDHKNSIMTEIVRSFDESISSKASKLTVQALDQKIENDCSSRSEIAEFRSGVETSIAD